MSSTMGAVVVICLVLIGAAFLAIMCAIALVYVNVRVSEFRDERRKAKLKEPEKPTACEEYGCPRNGGEHLCKNDPIDTAELSGIEAHAYLTDRKWYARMSGKEGAQ